MSDQHLYVQAKVEHFEITKISATPSTERGKILSKEYGLQAGAEAEEMHQVPCREAVGALIWPATMLRRDSMITRDRHSRRPLGRRYNACGARKGRRSAMEGSQEEY